MERAQEITGVGGIYAVLVEASNRPRYAFLVLQLVAEIADGRGQAGPFVAQGGMEGVDPQPAQFPGRCPAGEDCDRPHDPREAAAEKRTAPAVPARAGTRPGQLHFRKIHNNRVRIRLTITQVTSGKWKLKLPR